MLEIQKLVSLSFKSSCETSLPIKFVSLAQRKQILTLLNEEIVVWNDIDIRKLPYDIQINYSMFRRTYFLREYKVEDLMMFFNDRNKEDKDND